LPGQTYSLFWKVMSGDKQYTDTVNISFKPIDVTIVSGRNSNSPKILLTGNGIRNDSYKGEWSVSGDIFKYESSQAGGIILPKENFPTILVYGKENGTVNAKWTVTYGSVSFSDTITLKTGNYLEYEALVDLQMDDKPDYYKIEDGHITALEMGGMGTGWMFEDFDQNPSLRALKYLKRLVLYGTGLHSFPSSIPTFLKSLTYLDLSSNFLDNMPENIGELTNLETLIIDNQQDSHEIKHIPESLGDLKNLKRFKMSSVLIDLPSTFGNLTKLETFDFSGSSLNSVPESFGNLTSLKYFWLNGFHGNLPESFGRLINLREIAIGDSYLTKLPDSIGNLKKLKKIFIHGPNITISSLPEGFCQLDSLRELNLACIPLKELPLNFANLKNLESLVLYSDLSYLPQSICNLSTLKYLNIDGTKDPDIEFTIPDNIWHLSNLEGIYINNKNLHTITDNIGKLPKISDLALPNCELDSVPSTIGDLKTLSFLNLGGNNLSSIPLSFKNLRLASLSLQQNKDLAWQIDAIRSWGICVYLYY
jgi:Leucine-rich repeat (LRR) protein